MSRGTQAAEWVEHIKNQAQSGVSIAEYCRNKGLDPKAFSYQRNRVRKNSNISEERFTPLHTTPREIRVKLGKEAVDFHQ